MSIAQSPGFSLGPPRCLCMSCAVSTAGEICKQPMTPGPARSRSLPGCLIVTGTNSYIAEHEAGRGGELLRVAALNQFSSCRSAMLAVTDTRAANTKKLIMFNASTACLNTAADLSHSRCYCREALTLTTIS
ncbi:hypothetical protein BaRGS_00035542 [Batillaria attramentaria]|uniref:Uncharacterized protein n=1 Tax=Batillaria attramentaria TaxID=370345 RepID=A0ABD0JEF4_9CAEN